MVIAVCICRLVKIAIDLSETAQKSALQIRDKVQSETKSENFLSDNFFFEEKHSWILSQTEFCLGLTFVLDYIPQLYFICNHLINGCLYDLFLNSKCYQDMEK